MKFITLAALFALSALAQDIDFSRIRRGPHGTSVLKYGAIGDGVANDTAAIASAIAAAQSGTTKGVYFPAGTYAVCNITTTSSSSIFLSGDGIGASKIVRHSSCLQANTDMFDFTNAPVFIDSLDFDQLADGSVTTKNIVTISNATTGAITNSKFAHAQNVGLQVIDSDNIFTSGNYFYQAYFMGYAVSCTGGTGGTGPNPVYHYNYSDIGSIYVDMPFGIAFNFFCSTINVDSAFYKSSPALVQTPNAQAKIRAVVNGTHTYGLPGATDGVFLEGVSNATIDVRLSSPGVNGVYCLGSQLTIAPGPTIPLPCQNLTIKGEMDSVNSAWGLRVNGNSFPGTISAATNANPAVITANYAPATGQQVTLAGLTGAWTGLNSTFTATRISTTQFSVPLDSTAFGVLTASSPQWVILGKQIFFDGAHVTNSADCALVTSVNSVTASGTTCDNIQILGLQLANVHGATVQGSVLHNIGVASNSSYSGLIISDASKDISVASTVIKNDPGLNQMLYGIDDQVLNAGGASHVTIGNDVEIQNAAVPVRPASAIPTIGAWLAGDKVKAFAVPVSGPLGWINTTAGSPGTWKAYGYADPVQRSYVATENGANNAIACASATANPPLASGLTVTIQLAHTLQAGANTFAYNGGAALAIKSSLNTANNIATAYAATGVATLLYNGTLWVDLKQ